MNPNGPYQLRLGLSHCYYMLEDFDLAKIGFQSILRRVVNHHPERRLHRGYCWVSSDCQKTEPL